MVILYGIIPADYPTAVTFSELILLQLLPWTVIPNARMTMENITLLLAIFYFLQIKKEKRLFTCEKGKGSDTMTNSRPMRKFLAYFVRPKMFQKKKKEKKKKREKKENK